MKKKSVTLGPETLEGVYVFLTSYLKALGGMKEAFLPVDEEIRGVESVLHAISLAIEHVGTTPEPKGRKK